MNLALRFIELGSLFIVTWAAVRYLRADTATTLLCLILAGWLGEESSMALYRYYGYADGWLLFLHRTPLAVACVWPLVVLTSVEVVAAWPSARRHRGLASVLVGLLVVYDALVIEPVATRLGLWWWRAGSYFGVPVLGLLGWGVFGAVASALLSRFPLAGRPLRIVWLAPVMALCTQAVLAPLAFGSLTLGLRVPLSESTWAFSVGLLGLLLCPVAWVLRSRVQLCLADLRVKVAGSALFFGTIYALRLWPFYLCCSTIPLPYLFLALHRAPEGRREHRRC